MHEHLFHVHLREIANTLEILATQVRELASLYEAQSSQGEASHALVAEASSAEASDLEEMMEIEEAIEENGLGVIPLEEWLIKRGLEILAVRDIPPEGDILDPIVLRMGAHYADTPSLRTFLAEVRRNQDSGEKFTLSLKGVPGEEISTLIAISNELYRLALLSRHYYNRLEKALHAAPARSPNAINFFTGQWFERYVYLVFSQIMREHNRRFHVLHGVQVNLPNDRGAELDWLFWPEGETTPIWIEAKTGDYQKHVHKYERIRRMLGLPVSRSLLVILGLDERTVEQLNGLYGLTIVNEVGLRQALEDLVGSSGSNVNES